MKKNIFFIVAFLLFPLSVYANSIELKCENVKETNNQITCEIIGNSNEEIKEISFHISSSNMVSIESFIENEEWKIINNENNNILLNSIDKATNTFEIGKINLTITNDETGNIIIESVKYKTEDDIEKNIKSVKKTIPLSTNNSLLSNIIIENYLINFSRDTHSYNLKINDENKLNIIAIPENSDTTYTIVNNDNIIDGTEIQINTKSKDNMTSTYTLKISKQTISQTKDYKYIFAIVAALIVIINIIRLISSKRK